MSNILSPFIFRSGFWNDLGGGLFSTSPTVTGLRNFYVSNTLGNDSNDGLSTGSPFLTLLKLSQSVNTPGDVGNVMAGTYKEGSGSFWFSTEASLAVLHSGTEVNPIVFQAYPPDIGLVTIDSEGDRAGFFVNQQDYIWILNLRILNSSVVGIVNSNDNNTETYFSNMLESEISRGCVIEGNYIFDVNGVGAVGTPGIGGDNTAGIRMDNSVGWTVRNNWIERMRKDDLEPSVSTHTAAIQSFLVKDAIIDHNTIRETAVGVLWKDHWLEDDDSALQEDEVSYNDIIAFLIGCSGITGNIEPVGNWQVHHNILQAKQGLGINSSVNPNSYPGGNLDFNHNIIIGQNDGIKLLSTTVGVEYNGRGNMFLDHTNASLQSIDFDTPDIMKFGDSDYNVFQDTSFRVTVGENGSNAVGYNTLAEWQAATTASIPLYLSISNPDTNSIESNKATLFNDADAGDFTNKTGSPAIGLMPDGSNAGPYQLGTETIGVTGGGAY